jgi:hypothetical protein
VSPRGVREECIFGVGSLILMVVDFLPMTFLALGGGASVAAALHLPVHVFKELAPGLPDAAPTESALGSRVKTRISGMGVSALMSGMCEMKLSRACDEPQGG